MGQKQFLWVHHSWLPQLLPQQSLSLAPPVQCKASAVLGWQPLNVKVLVQNFRADQPLVISVVEIAEGLELCS